MRRKERKPESKEIGGEIRGDGKLQGERGIKEDFAAFSL